MSRALPIGLVASLSLLACDDGSRPDNAALPDGASVSGIGRPDAALVGVTDGAASPDEPARGSRERVAVQQPLVVAGTVVNSRTARPVPGADVHVWAWPSGAGPVVRSVETDAEGRFELRGELHPGPHELFVERAGFVPTTAHAFRTGSADLRAELAPLGTLAGSVRLDPDVDPEEIRVRFGSLTGRLTDDAGFELITARAEPGRIEFEFTPEAVVVASFDGLTPRTAEEPADPRLDGIDLRGLLRAIDVDVVGPDGAAVEGARIELRAPEGDPLFGGRRIGPEWGARVVHAPEGHVRIHTTRPRLDATVYAPGFRERRAEDLRGNHRLALERFRPEDSPVW